MSAVVRIKELRRNRGRRNKLHNLRKRYQQAKTEEEKTRILEKTKRVAPWLSKEEFTAPLKIK